MFRLVLSGIKRNFVIDYKKTKKNCKVKLVGIGTDLVFNSKGVANVSEKLNDNTQYKCKYDERLHLYTTEEDYLISEAEFILKLIFLVLYLHLYSSRMR